MSDLPWMNIASALREYARDIDKGDLQALGRVRVEVLREWAELVEGQEGRAVTVTSMSDAVQSFAIRVEKMLCKALGREWSATGISVESLIEELAAAGENAARYRWLRDHAHDDHNETRPAVWDTRPDGEVEDPVEGDRLDRQIDALRSAAPGVGDADKKFRAGNESLPCENCDEIWELHNVDNWCQRATPSPASPEVGVACGKCGVRQPLQHSPDCGRSPEVGGLVDDAMVERAAKFLRHRSNPGGFSWDEINEGVRDAYRKDAREFIAALAPSRQAGGETRKIVARLHRGGLADAMQTAAVIDATEDAVRAFFAEPAGVIEVKPYGWDQRIGWDTHIVCVDGNAVGFTNGPLAAALAPAATDEGKARG